MSTKILPTLAVIGALAAGAAAPADAYRYRTCDGDKVRWPSSSVTYRPMNVSFPAGSPDRVALERVRENWNSRSPGGRFRLSFSYTDDTRWEQGDGVNDVAFTDDYDWGDSTIGVTLNMRDACWAFDDGAIQESDVMFNPSVDWSLAIRPPAADPAVEPMSSFVLVGVHEFGHSLGLKHENRWMATMNSFYPAAGVIGYNNDADPHADDTRGARVLYGTADTLHDVAVSLYERTDSGESGLIRAPGTARRGESITVRMTVSNRGTVREDYVLVDVYASSGNRYISSSDVYLGAAAFWMEPGFEGTFDVTLPLPRSMSGGSYYVGFLADPGFVIPEIEEWNNMVAYTTSTSIF